MKCDFKYSLPVRVGKIIAVFSLALVASYTTMLALLYEWGLADATHGFILQEAQMFQQGYAKNRDHPLPASELLKSYIGKENIPEEVLKDFPPDKTPNWHLTKDGLRYKFRKNESSESHLHMLVRDLPDTDKKLYMFHHTNVPDELTTVVWRKFKVLAVVGGILVICMLIVFHRIIQRSLSPIGSLSRWVSDIKEEGPLKELPSDIYDDEIGHLARVLYESLERLHEHNEKERQFLRNASHELRTPIAIIRNTMDVIDHKNKDKNSQNCPMLIRIRRASDTMKLVTEALLWLANEGYTPPRKKLTELKPLVTELLEENRLLLSDRNVELNINIDKFTQIEIETALLHITLDNLIRNAFQHCSDGEISVTSTGTNQIEIRNQKPCYDHCQSTSEGIAKSIDSGGFGLGLALVKKIAEKQHWQFNMKFEDSYAIASLKFS